MQKASSLTELIQISSQTLNTFLSKKDLENRLYNFFPDSLTHKKDFLDYLHSHLPLLKYDNFVFQIILPSSLSDKIDLCLQNFLKKIFVPFNIKLNYKFFMFFSFSCEPKREYLFYEFRIHSESQKWIEKNSSLILEKLKCELIKSLKGTKTNLSLSSMPSQEKKGFHKLQNLEDKISHLFNQKKSKTSPFLWPHFPEKKLPFSFTSGKKASHLSQIVAYETFFKNNIQKLLLEKPQKRHVRLKIFKIQKNHQNLLAILIVFNLSSTLERFDKENLLEALLHINPHLPVVEDSFFTDQSHDKISSFYIEIHRDPLSPEDIKKIQTLLSEECKARIENIFHPIFMPRNEEELFKNIILLSQQIHSVKDIPQVILQYEKQEGKNVVFTVLWVRVITNETPALSVLFNTAKEVALVLNEVKSCGFIKKKHKKEANIFTISFDKSLFIRKDQFLDLQKARLYANQKLLEILGEFRDYNGGMINKQLEALAILKSRLSSISEDIVEEFFYSIKPAYMQTILPLSLLEVLFQTIDSLQKEKLPFIYRNFEHDHYFIVIFISQKNCKDKTDSVIQKMNISSSDLTESFFNFDNMYCLSYIYRTQKRMQKAILLRNLLKELENIKIKESFHFNQPANLIENSRN
jgi:hypothetical protein